MCKLVQGLKTINKKPSHAHSLSIEITFQLRAPEGVSQKAALTGDELTEKKKNTNPTCRQNQEPTDNRAMKGTLT